MSIDIEIGSSLSNEDAAHLAARAAAITTAMQRAEERHSGYSWVWTDEIRCRGCNASLDIPVLASTNANADKAFQSHLAAELDALLAAGSSAAENREL
jgi:Ni,Fe-hydrogenase I small subunit